MISLGTLRRYAIARSLFTPTTLPQAMDRLGFVQADPIRAPARAQDLILRHRVRDYRVADLERHYPTLAIDEDYFVNYGFLPQHHQRLLHPRSIAAHGGARARRRIADLLAFARERGEIHPRDAHAHFAHGQATNYWGGTSRATTLLLDRMHYQGLLRVARRDQGVRVYAPRNASTLAAAADRQAQAQALLRLVVHLYAPLPAASLARLVAMLRRVAPQSGAALQAAAARAGQLLAHTRLAGTVWYWPSDEQPADHGLDAQPAVRFLAPFDPVVWDRRRFERFWGWAYRFEAYTPAVKRCRGYYALPLLWRDEVIGWGNLSIEGARLLPRLGYIAGRQPRSRVFRRELAAELARLTCFLGL
jgi:uncharacterized protein YcaQ